MHRSLIDAIAPVQNGCCSNGDEEPIHIPQSESFTIRCSLVSYPGGLFLQGVLN